MFPAILNKKTLIKVYSNKFKNKEIVTESLASLNYFCLIVAYKSKFIYHLFHLSGFNYGNSL